MGSVPGHTPTMSSLRMGPPPLSLSPLGPCLAPIRCTMDAYSEDLPRTDCPMETL